MDFFHKYSATLRTEGRFEELALFPRSKWLLPEKGLQIAFFVDKEKQTLDGCVFFGPQTAGAPNTVHGGALTSVLDDAVGRLGYHLNLPTATASITVSMKKLIKIDSCVRIRCTLEKQEGRKIFMKGSLESLPEETPHVVYCEGTALLIFLKHESRVERGELDKSPEGSGQNGPARVGAKL